MVERYNDLVSEFPSKVDNLPRFSDLDLSTYFQAMQYLEKVQLGDFDGADLILKENPTLKNKVITADVINSLRDSIIAVQRMFKDDVHGYILNAFNWKGTWSVTTQYEKFDVVTLHDNERDQIYIAITDNIPTGTPVSDTKFWAGLVIKGDRGSDGVGFKFIGSWSNAITYNENEAVEYNGMIYASKVGSNLNHQPTGTNDAYWHKALGLPLSVNCMKRMIKITSPVTRLTFTGGAITSFNKNIDVLRVYLNSVKLIEGTDYTINNDNVSINSMDNKVFGSSEWNTDSEQVFEFEVWRSMINNLVFSDGQSIKNGTVTKDKLSLDVQNQLDSAMLAISQTQPTGQRFWLKLIRTEE